jgi:hypothetical protein
LVMWHSTLTSRAALPERSTMLLTACELRTACLQARQNLSLRPALGAKSACQLRYVLNVFKYTSGRSSLPHRFCTQVRSSQPICFLHFCIIEHQIKKENCLRLYCISIKKDPALWPGLY